MYLYLNNHNNLHKNPLKKEKANSHHVANNNYNLNNPLNNIQIYKYNHNNIRLVKKMKRMLNKSLVRNKKNN